MKKKFNVMFFINPNLYKCIEYVSHQWQSKWFAQFYSDQWPGHCLDAIPNFFSSGKDFARWSYKSVTLASSFDGIRILDILTHVRVIPARSRSKIYVQVILKILYKKDCVKYRRETWIRIYRTSWLGWFIYRIGCRSKKNRFSVVSFSSLLIERKDTFNALYKWLFTFSTF